MRFSAGTRTSWSANADVSVARWPILSRCCSIVTPGASIGTMNADMPLLPAARVGLREDDRPGRVAGVRDERLRAVEDVLVALAHRGRLQRGDVRAGARLREAERAEDRRLDERREPRRLLLVAAERGSPGRRRGRSRRSEVPMPAQPQYSSSPTSIPSKDERPRPPYSSGTWRFIRPTSCAFAITSAGWRMCSSYSRSSGPDLLRGELAGELAQRLLLVGQGERDARSRYPCSIVDHLRPPDPSID